MFGNIFCSKTKIFPKSKNTAATSAVPSSLFSPPAAAARPGSGRSQPMRGQDEVSWGDRQPMGGREIPCDPALSSP